MEPIESIKEGICPLCVFVEKKGVRGAPFCPAVIEVDTLTQRVYLTVRCEHHGEVRTLYSSNAPFFRKMLHHDSRILPSVVGDGASGKESSRASSSSSGDVVPKTNGIDIEESDQFGDRSELRPPPLLFELSLFENNQFVPNYVLRQKIEEFSSIVRNSRQGGDAVRYVLKVAARQALDIDILNSQIDFIADIAPPEALILAELTCDRVAAIASREDSVFLNPRIHPSLRVHAVAGAETDCAAEIDRALEAVKTLTNIRLTVSLSVNLDPLPDLSHVLSRLREEARHVVAIIISPERSASSLGAQLSSAIRSQTFSSLETPLSIDSFPFVESLESWLGVSLDDLYPISTASCLEPFLRLFGYGEFRILPSALCGFGTILVTTPSGSCSGLPLSKVVDVDAFYASLEPLLPTLRKNPSSISLWQGRKLKKALTEALRDHELSSRGLPSSSQIFSYFHDEEKSGTLHETIDCSQIVVVHMKMDVAAFDASRRRKCSFLVSTSQTSSGLGAACTHCML